MNFSLWSLFVSSPHFFFFSFLVLLMVHSVFAYLIVFINCWLAGNDSKMLEMPIFSKLMTFKIFSLFISNKFFLGEKRVKQPAPLALTHKIERERERRKKEAAVAIILISFRFSLVIFSLFIAFILCSRWLRIFILYLTECGFMCVYVYFQIFQHATHHYVYTILWVAVFFSTL